jgi:hypothetical protein
MGWPVRREYVKRVEIDPPPARPVEFLGSFTNFEQPGSGISWADAVAPHWSLTVHWNEEWAQSAELADILGLDATGHVDLSPRVVYVCPGQEFALGVARGPFGPREVTHPAVYHCPGW